MDEGNNEVRIAVGAATDAGGRDGNEDAVLIAEIPPVARGAEIADAGTLMALADGMGGHQRGEVASKLAIETVQAALVSNPHTDMALLLKQAFREANRTIFRNGREAGDGAMMGTTLVVAATRGKYVTIANVGDSRAYLVRANRLTQITQDHSLVAEQVSQGTLTQQEARESPHRNIVTHALGQREKLDQKMPNIFELTLLPEDRLLLCSDGFYDVVEDDDFVSVLLRNDPDSAARRLVELANERGTTDNVSAVVAEVTPVRVLEPVLAGAGADRGGLGTYLVPALVLLGAVVFIALVILALALLG
ncbi:MAG: protein phosphatase 2C domain-containing protein [Chloroflexota bacterium]|nr:protein phosphatase 2C domain-containing protein [Chloroflexota bacterium]